MAQQRAQPAGAEGARSQFDAYQRRRHPKVSVAVAREIVGGIVRGDLKPGSKLPSESAMVEQYGVGRATLREALRILEVLGIIQMRSGPGGGPVVTGAGVEEFGSVATAYFKLTGATYRDLVEARLAIEPLLARLAAEREDHKSVATQMVESTRMAKDPDLHDEQWASTANDFHTHLSTLSGNPIIDLVAGALKAVWFDRVVGTVFPGQERAKVVDDHAHIADAIGKGNAVRAEKLMRAHMQEFLEYSILRYPGMLDEVIDW